MASSDGSHVDYAYDALGRLARRVEHPVSGPDVVTLFFHDGTSEQVAVEADGAGGVHTRYLLDSQGEPVGQEKNGARSYYVDDPRGNLTQQVDGSANVVAVYGYDPYGKEKKNLTRTAGSNSNWDSRLRVGAEGKGMLTLASDVPIIVLLRWIELAKSDAGLVL